LSLAREWRTFRAVFIRNMKLFTAYKAWIVATIIWPIPLLALNIYTYSALGTTEEVSNVFLQQYGYPFAGTIVVGTIVYLLYNRLLWGTGISIQRERWMGTIEVLFITPTNKMTILLASGVSSLVEASWWIVCIFFLGGAIFGLQPSITSVPAVVMSIVSTMAALIAVGVFFGGFFVLTRAASDLAGGLQAPIRFFSGVAFPVDALPRMLQYISYLIPVTYGILVLRSAILQGASVTAIWVDLLPLYIVAAIFMVAGYITLGMVERQAKKKGTLYLI
jgi:ABC-2 type transport system permease protein